jgi:hypothetical protein
LTVAGAASDTIDWSKRFWFLCAFTLGAVEDGGIPPGLLRMTVGRSQTGGAAGQLSGQGIGFEVDASGQLYLVLHDGESLVRTAVGRELKAGDSRKHTVLLTSDGGGNVGMALDGAEIGTWAGGPRTQGAPFQTAVACELVKGVQSQTNTVWIHAMRAGWGE